MLDAYLSQCHDIAVNRYMAADIFGGTEQKAQEHKGKGKIPLPPYFLKPLRMLNKCKVFFDSNTIVPFCDGKAQDPVASSAYITLEGKPLNKDLIDILKIAQERCDIINKATLEGRKEVDMWLTAIPAVTTEQNDAELQNWNKLFSVDANVFENTLLSGTSKLFPADEIKKELRHLIALMPEVDEARFTPKDWNRSATAKALAEARKEWQ